MLRFTLVLGAFYKASCLQLEEAATYDQQQQRKQLQLEQQLLQLQEQQQRLLQQQQLLLQQRPAPARKGGPAAQPQGLQHKHAPVSMSSVGAQGPQHKHAPVSMLAFGEQVGHAQRHAARPSATEAHAAPAVPQPRRLTPSGAPELRAAPGVSQPRRQPHHAWKSPLQLSFVQESDEPIGEADAAAQAQAAGGEAVPAPGPEPRQLRSSQPELVRDELAPAAEAAFQEEPMAQPTANDAASDLAAPPEPQPDQAAAPQLEEQAQPPLPEAAAEAPQLDQWSDQDAAVDASQTDQALPPSEPEASRLEQAPPPPQELAAALPPQPETAAEAPQLEQAPAPELEAAAPAQQQQEQVQEAAGMYQLRLCNAYAWQLPLEMRRVEAPMLVEHPLPYKACRDYRLPLREGDQLEFSAGDVSIGTFSVRGLPQDPRSQLLLIPRRRDAVSMAVAFDSHIFHPAVGPQVAVIDAYQGAQRSILRIKEPTREEELSFNSVVDVVPGSYRLTLEGASRRIGDTPQTTVLNTQGNSDYVVLRVGTGSESWPEELIVFPHSGGARATVCAAVVALLGLLSAM